MYRWRTQQRLLASWYCWFVSVEVPSWLTWLKKEYIIKALDDLKRKLRADLRNLEDSFKNCDETCDDVNEIKNEVKELQKKNAETFGNNNNNNNNRRTNSKEPKIKRQIRRDWAVPKLSQHRNKRCARNKRRIRHCQKYWDLCEGIDLRLGYWRVSPSSHL